MLYRVARRLAANPSEAEDLVGQTLLNAASAWSRFDGAYPRGWLIRILTNCHLRVLRERNSRPVPTGIDPDRVVSEPWNAIDWGLCGAGLLEHVDRLPEEFRLAVYLCDVEGLSYDEAATGMDVPVGTLKSRLLRGRRELRRRLASMEKEIKG